MKKSSAIVTAIIIILVLIVLGWWIIKDSCRPSNSELAKNFAEVIAIVIGGWWACYRFGLLRENKPAIGIELIHECIPDANQCYLTWFDVILTNKGKVKAEARKKRDPAYSDKYEKLKYSCSLLLRAIPQNVPQGEPICWFNAEVNQKGSPLPTDIEADLLDNYDYEMEGKTYFWMEPAESYHLGVGYVLPSGVYLAMVTFVGRNDDEFWRREFILQIQNQKLTAKN
jgi:hypothetical protein